MTFAHVDKKSYPVCKGLDIASGIIAGRTIHYSYMHVHATSILASVPLRKVKLCKSLFEIFHVLLLILLRLAAITPIESIVQP
jgi:hypothetical protein